MIDINTYRSRIGQFSQKIKNRKYLYRPEYPYKYWWNQDTSGQHACKTTKVILKICLILVLLCGSSSSPGQLGQSLTQGGQLDQSLPVGGGQVSAAQGGGIVRVHVQSGTVWEGNCGFEEFSF